MTFLSCTPAPGHKVPTNTSRWGQINVWGLTLDESVHCCILLDTGVRQVPKGHCSPHQGSPTFFRPQTGLMSDNIFTDRSEQGWDLVFLSFWFLENQPFVDFFFFSRWQRFYRNLKGYFDIYIYKYFVLTSYHFDPFFSSMSLKGLRRIQWHKVVDL